MNQFPCLGFGALGLCSYDPGNPPNLYFSLGEAVAALAFTFAIQQFIKPIYRFRLRAYRIKLWHLLVLVVAGVFCAGVAALLPNIPLSRSSFLHYPIFWELIGAVLIGAAYIASAFVALLPAKVYDANLISFVRAGAALLSEAEDADRVSFAEDLLGGKNLERLIQYAAFWRRVDWHETRIEFERLKEAGQPQSIRGQPPVCAFYRFAHRTELERATYAGSFLRIISDPTFCLTLVRRCPWLTASAIERTIDRRIHSDEANPFIQAIAAQAILSDESMMAKEISYDGFGTAPILSESLFSSWFLLTNYRPLDRLRFRSPDNPTEGYISRLNSAGEMILKTAISEGDYWPRNYVHDLASAYESLFLRLRVADDKNVLTRFPISLYMGIPKLAEIVVGGLEEVEADRRKRLFVTDTKAFRSDLVHSVASILYESITCFANDFTGADHPAWSYAIRLLDLYPRYGDQPKGLNPLQQQFAIQLVEKLRENMKGRYPAVSRVLLAVIGPYKEDVEDKQGTAHAILKHAVYAELKMLKELAKTKPEKVSDYLPTNVTYDAATDTLTHTYRGGERVETNLSKLDLRPINLLHEETWRL